MDSQKTRQIVIADSVSLCNDPGVSKQKLFIVDGIREGAQMFYEKVKEYEKNGDKPLVSNNFTPSNSSATIKYFKNENSEVLYLDTFDLIPSRKSNSKSGGEVRYYIGTQTTFGTYASYLEIFNKPGDSFEKCLSAGLLYFHVERPGKQGYLLGFGTEGIGRYNFSDKLDGAFFDFSINILSGAEKISEFESKFIFGGMSEQCIGIYIFSNLAFKAGLYEQGYLGSELLPYDFGLVFGINIIGDY